MYIRCKRLYKKAKGKAKENNKNITDKDTAGDIDRWLDSDKIVASKDVIPGYIVSSTPTEIIICGDREEVTNGWVEVLAVLINMLYMKDREKFKEALMSNNVTSMDLCVDTEYGKYELADKYKFVSYSLYDTGYHLELRMIPEVIIKAFKGLVIANGYQFADINLVLKAKYKNLEGYIVKGIDEGIDIVENNEMFLEKLMILGEQINVHRLDIAAVVLAKWITRDNSWGEISKTDLSDRFEGTFISDTPVKEQFVDINNGMVLNTDLEVSSIRSFFNRVGKGFKLEDDILFIFRKDKPKETLKEWELE